METGRGTALRVLAAALLVCGVACGGEAGTDGPGVDPGGLDGTGGTGGDGGDGGVNGMAPPPPGIEPIDRTSLGGPAPEELLPVGRPGTGKGGACPKGTGLLHLRKDWCAPGADGAWGGCDETESAYAVAVTVKKIAPKVDVIWEGWISEADEYRACVPVGTYRIWEDCGQLPADASCLDPGPFEVEVRERKATKHTFYNVIGPPARTGLLEIRKAFCLEADGATAAPPAVDCTAAHSDHAIEVDVRKAGTQEMVWSGVVTEDAPAALLLPPGSYEVEERCDALPTAFVCLDEGPIAVDVVEQGEHAVDLRNLVRLEEVRFEKEVTGCLEPTCGGVRFAIDYRPAPGTPKVEYFLDGAWASNEGSLLLAPLEPIDRVLPFGAYVAKERKAEGFEPRKYGGDVQRFEVPWGRVFFENVFDLKQCQNGKDDDRDGNLDCAEPACLDNDYLGCSRDACYFGAFIELRRVCNPGDTGCLEADIGLRIESRDTIWGQTPSFAGTFVFPGGEDWRIVHAPCGTYEVEVIPPPGYVAVDPVFLIEVPSYAFPVKLHLPGAPVPPDPDDL